MSSVQQANLKPIQVAQDLIRLGSPITNNQITVWETSGTDGELPTIVIYAPPPCAKCRRPRHEAGGYRPAKQYMAR